MEKIQGNRVDKPQPILSTSPADASSHRPYTAVQRSASPVALKILLQSFLYQLRISSSNLKPEQGQEGDLFSRCPARVKYTKLEFSRTLEDAPEIPVMA